MKTILQRCTEIVASATSSWMHEGINPMPEAGIGMMTLVDYALLAIACRRKACNTFWKGKHFNRPWLDGEREALVELAYKLEIVIGDIELTDRQKGIH